MFCSANYLLRKISGTILIPSLSFRFDTRRSFRLRYPLVVSHFTFCSFLSVFRFLTACLVCTKWNFVFSSWVQKLNSLDIAHPADICHDSDQSALLLGHHVYPPHSFSNVTGAGNKPLRSFKIIDKQGLLLDYAY